jgi:cytochrome c5
MLDQTGVDVAGGSENAVVVSESDQASGLDLEQGKKIVQSSCYACHGTGAAGAPKIGDKAAWAPRIAQGRETLLANSIQGLRAMPPRGACMTCSDDDLKAAIDYMISQIQ